MSRLIRYDPDGRYAFRDYKMMLEAVITRAPKHVVSLIKTHLEKVERCIQTKNYEWGVRHRVAVLLFALKGKPPTCSCPNCAQIWRTVLGEK